MSAKIPAFTDIGKSAKDVLLGGKEGVFQYNQQVTLSSKTADGVEFTASSVKKGSDLETAIKAGYKHKNITSVLSFNHLGKLTGSASVSDVAPGLSASLVGTLPDPHSLKLTLEYYLPHFTIKSLVGLTASPTVNTNVSFGYNDFTFGGNFVADTARNEPLTNWTVGAGYTRLDYQVAALLADKGETLKVTGAHNIDARQALAVEVAKSLTKDEATILTVGYQKRLEQGGLAKVRLDNTGSLLALYEVDAQKNTKLAISSQFDAKNFEKAPKFGVALDIKN